jgi:type 1 fimbria pilin
MKMNKLVIAMVMALASGAASAADTTPPAQAGVQGAGTVTFKGAIIDAPCSIAPGYTDQEVDLGSVATGSLKDSHKSTPVQFKIELENCSADVVGKTVNMTFAGAKADPTMNLLALSGTAKGAGVGMTHAGNDIELGKVTPLSNVMAEGNNTLEFAAYVQATGTTVTPGEFESVTNFTMAYK